VEIGNAVGGLHIGYAIREYAMSAPNMPLRTCWQWHSTGRYKLLAILGPFISSLGFILHFLEWHGRTSLAELMYIIPGGFGTAVSQSTTFVQLTAGVGAKDFAIAGCSLYLSKNMGIAVGPTIMTAVLQSAL
jgi:hypothetical protein